MALAFFAVAMRALRAFVVPRTRFELGSPFVIVLQKYPIYSQRFSLFTLLNQDHYLVLS